MSLIKRCIAEFIGTFWLVFGGCGSAVLAATFTADGAKLGENTAFPLGIGLVGVSLAFGLTVLTMAYAISVTFPVVILTQLFLLVCGQPSDFLPLNYLSTLVLRYLERSQVQGFWL